MKPAPKPSRPLLNPKPSERGPLSAVFRTLEDILRTDDDFRSVCNVLRAWNGDPDDAAPPADGEFPWCRITPVNSASGRHDETSAVEVTQVIMVETAVEGLNVDDSDYFYGLFRKALRQDKGFRNSTVFAALRASGLYTYEHTMTAFGPRAVPPADPNAPGARTIRCLYGVGRFTARLILPE